MSVSKPPVAGGKIPEKDHWPSRRAKNSVSAPMGREKKMHKGALGSITQMLLPSGEKKIALDFMLLWSHLTKFKKQGLKKSSHFQVP